MTQRNALESGWDCSLRGNPRGSLGALCLGAGCERGMHFAESVGGSTALSQFPRTEKGFPSSIKTIRRLSPHRNLEAEDGLLCRRQSRVFTEL